MKTKQLKKPRSRTKRQDSSHTQPVTKKPCKPVLEDAIAMRRQYPDTFEYVDLREVVDLKPGRLVKVCDGEERFWVTLTEVDLPVLVGTVSNNLLGNKLAHGDLIEFDIRNLYQVLPVTPRVPQ